MSKVLIEIASQKVENRSGHSNRTGKPYSINEQEAFLHKPGQVYPEKMKITLGDNQQPYPVGKFELDADSFYVDRFGSLAVRPVLKAQTLAKAS